MMRHPEKKFWMYVSLLSGAIAVLMSGQMISCAKAEPNFKNGHHHHPVPEPEDPWNQPGPSVNSVPGITLHAALDRGAVLRNGEGIVRVEVNVEAGDEPDGAANRDSDIVVVVDTSGSMEGEKMDFARQALLALVDRLGPGDRLGLVEYSSSARVLAPLTSVRARNRSRLKDLAQQLHAGGSTNMSGGLDRGIELLQRADGRGRPGRLILLSDGLANAGDASPQGLRARARRLAGQGFALTTMGIGEDFDESVMTSLATAGTGAFYYLAKLNYLSEFFDAELNSAKNTYAQRAQLRFHAGNGVRLESAMGLPVQRQGRLSTVTLGNIYAARKRTVWITLRVPTYSLGQKDLGRLSLSYRRHGGSSQVSVGALPKVACLDDERIFEKHIHRSIWERALMDDVFNKSEEEFGDAIRSGDRRQLEGARVRSQKERSLARRLGSTVVLEELESLERKAESAAVAQSAPAKVRAKSAKKQKARAYQKRNKGAYDDASRAMESF